jgi:PAS domain S-box-containing protein
MLEYIFIDRKAKVGDPNILLSVSRAADRRLIKKNISGDYNIIDNRRESKKNYDLCITDLSTFQSHRKELLEMKEVALPVYFPIILLVENSRLLKKDPSIWDQVDDVIEVPVPIKMLNMRIKNQLRTRKHSLQIVRQNEKLHILEKAVNSTDVGITITDANNKDDQPIIFANDGFTNLSGYSREEVLGRNCRFLQADDHNQDGLVDIRDHIKNGEKGSSIIRNYKKDGTPFWNELSIAPIENDAGELTHFIGIQNDISKLIDVQEELRHEKDMHQLVTKNSTDMISRHSLDGTYLYVTPSSEQVLGFTPEELVGQNAFDNFHPDDLERVEEAHKVLHTNPEDNKTITVSYRKKTKSGEYKWVETVSRATLNPENDTVVEIQANTRDITTRKKYEHELEESVEEKKVLLQEIHHRVKNNLAVISGLLQIQQFDSENKELNKILGNSISRIKSMALIHEKLYRSESLSHLNFREYIEDLVSSIEKSYNLGENIDIHIDCDNTVLNVNQAVPCALILNEVISNAMEHAFPEKRKGTIWVSFKEHGDKIHASIKDNGVGIPDSVLKGEKMNMGFTIIQTLMRQLNAAKEFKNEDGTELNFTFDRQNISGAHSRFV